MTNTQTLTLTDSTAGTWTSLDGTITLTGCPIGPRRDYGALADAMRSQIEALSSTLVEATILCVDPARVDFFGALDTDPVVTWQIADGQAIDLT